MALWNIIHTHIGGPRAGRGRERQTDRYRKRQVFKKYAVFLISCFPWQVHISTTGLIVTPPPSSPVTTGPSFTFPSDVSYQAALGVSTISVSFSLRRLSLDDLAHSDQLPPCPWMLARWWDRVCPSPVASANRTKKVRRLLANHLQSF